MQLAAVDVVVPVYRDVRITIDCLESVLAKSGSVLGRLVVVNDASPEAGMLPALTELAARDPRVQLIDLGVNHGFVGASNRGLRERSGDVVLLNSDTIVTEGWLEELRAVAHSHERIGCVFPLSNNATIGSVPAFVQETPASDVDAAKVKQATARLPRYTVTPTAVGFCMYLKGAVLDFVGELDPVFGRGYNEENDWAMRAQTLGFIACRANHAFVYHLGSISFLTEKNDLDQFNAALLNSRHPAYLPQVRKFVDTVDAHVAAHAVRVELTGKLRVALDVRHVNQTAVGTNSYAHRLAEGLVARPDVELTLVGAQAMKVSGARYVNAGERVRDVEIIHKPAQIFAASDLPLLFGTSAHVVISYLDLIAHRIPSIFPSLEAARMYQTLNYQALTAAQAIIAISDAARQEIIGEFGVEESCVHTTLLAVDHESFRPSATRRQAPTDRLRQHANGQFFMSLATDFPHKNLRHLIDAYRLLREQWDDPNPPVLILAGNATGVRGGLYDAITSGRMRADGVIFLGAVNDAELKWLYQAAAAFVFPSVYEGFGLPLLEAMAAGTPVLTTGYSSIPEVVGDAALITTSAQNLADGLRAVVREPTLREQLFKRGQERVAAFSWRRTIEQTVGAYRAAIRAPSVRSLRARAMLRPELYIERPAVSAPMPDVPGIKGALHHLRNAVKSRAIRERRRLGL